MNYKKIRPVILIPPGEHIKEELKERNWTQKDFADILGVSEKTVSKIINAKQTITSEIANLIAKAFGTSAELWLNLESHYRSRLKSNMEKEKIVEQKSLIYNNIDVPELKKKGWLSSSVNIIESIKRILGIDNNNYNFKNFFNMELSVHFRKTTEKEQNKNHIKLWVEMSRRISEEFYKNNNNFDKIRLVDSVKKLHEYSNKKNGVTEFIELLNKHGVTFFVLSHLSKTYIDGASFFSKTNPVIVYTNRYDRLDNFWFVIAHELGHIVKHIKNKNDFFCDDLENIDDSIIEKEADDFALKLLKKEEIITYFQNYKRIYENDIRKCSKDININPSIIVGILQYQNILSYKYHNKLKRKVSNLIPEKYIAVNFLI